MYKCFDIFERLAQGCMVLVINAYSFRRLAYLYWNGLSRIIIDLINCTGVSLFHGLDLRSMCKVISLNENMFSLF